MMSNWKRPVEEAAAHLPTGLNVATVPMVTLDNIANLALQVSVTSPPMVVRLLVASLAIVTDTPTFAMPKVAVVFASTTQRVTIANVALEVFTETPSKDRPSIANLALVPTVALVSN